MQFALFQVVTSQKQYQKRLFFNILVINNNLPPFRPK